MPALFQAASAASARGQRSYLRKTAARLLLILAAAVISLLTIYIRNGHIDWAGVAALAAFVAAALLDISLLLTNPRKDWYDGRAIAESIKTLTWRFVVGGMPFPSSMPTEIAERQFVSEVDRLLTSVPSTRILPSAAPTITKTMRTLRETSLDERRGSYIAERIIEQQRWYASRAKRCQASADRWRIVLLLFEASGATAALLKALGILHIPIEGVVAAAAGAAASWLELREYDRLARGYSYAAIELSGIQNHLQISNDESSWSEAVAEAEQAISREHMAWRARRTYHP
jgi:hypothetical protein